MDIDEANLLNSFCKATVVSIDAKLGIVEGIGYGPIQPGYWQEDLKGNHPLGYREHAFKITGLLEEALEHFTAPVVYWRRSTEWALLFWDLDKQEAFQVELRQRITYECT